MMQNFTLKLISYLYGECSVDDSIKITNDILVDDDLRNDLNALVNAKKEFESFLLFSPEKEVIRNILDYSNLAI